MKLWGSLGVVGANGLLCTAFIRILQKLERCDAFQYDGLIFSMLLRVVNKDIIGFADGTHSMFSPSLGLGGFC